MNNSRCIDGAEDTKTTVSQSLIGKPRMQDGNFSTSIPSMITLHARLTHPWLVEWQFYFQQRPSLPWPP